MCEHLFTSLLLFFSDKPSNNLDATMNPTEQVAQMERIIKYTFNDRQLAVESLFHGGIFIRFDDTQILPQRNERLAIMGDKLLDLLLIRKWYTTQISSGKGVTRVYRNVLTCCRPSSLHGGVGQYHP